MASIKKKILLAEDDKFISKAYKAGLEKAGFEVITSLDGDAALEDIKSKNPDIILLDIIMPGKNGFEIMSEIKSDENLKKIPVIVLSNLGQESDIKKGDELGAVDYMIKSNFSMKEVIEKIKFHLAKQK